MHVPAGWGHEHAHYKFFAGFSGGRCFAMEWAAAWDFVSFVALPGSIMYESLPDRSCDEWVSVLQFIEILFEIVL